MIEQDELWTNVDIKVDAIMVSRASLKFWLHLS